MNILLFNIILVLIASQFVSSAVLKSPNPDDRQYWKKYGENYLKKILASQNVKSGEVAKNVVIFVGDGMGMPTISAGRIFKGQMKGRSGEETSLVFEDFPHLGFAKTYNTDKQVPDSAGTATAIFTGVKTRYAVVGLDASANLNNTSSEDRLGSFIDWAQAANKRTGIVTTTRITHATPAGTYAYSPDRFFECDTKIPTELKSKIKDIATQLVEDSPGKNMNVIMGGGRDFLGVPLPLPENYTQIQFPGSGEIGCNRTDKRNLVEYWLSNKNDSAYVTNTEQLLALNPDKTDYLMGLFANNHMTYDIVRNRNSDGEPSLSQMTKAAIQVLNNKNNKNGFVLMVEGGRIDSAHHQNLARAALQEFVEFEKAIEESVEALKGTDTLFIVTADHSHAMIFNGYGERGNDIFGLANKTTDVAYEALTYATGPGYWKHRSTEENVTWIAVENISQEERSNPLYMHLAAVGMGDAAHSGEDVPVFAIGKGSNLIQGVFEQNYIAYVISYSTCIGPVAHLNPECRRSGRPKTSGQSSIHTISITLLISNFIYLFMMTK